MSRKITTPLVALAALIGMGSLVTACNTVEGVGEDVEQAGQTIDNTAEQTHDGNPNTP